jgi:hypothetical protein
LLKVMNSEQNEGKKSVCSYELTLNCEKIVDKKG